MGETHPGAAAGKAFLTPNEKGTFRFSGLDIRLATASWKSGMSPFRSQRDQQIPLPVAAKTGIVRAVRHD